MSLCIDLSSTPPVHSCGVNYSQLHSPILLYGHGNSVQGEHNIVFGNENLIRGDYNIVFGKMNRVEGLHNIHLDFSQQPWTEELWNMSYKLQKKYFTNVNHDLHCKSTSHRTTNKRKHLMIDLTTTTEPVITSEHDVTMVKKKKTICFSDNVPIHLQVLGVGQFELLESVKWIVISWPGVHSHEFTIDGEYYSFSTVGTNQLWNNLTRELKDVFVQPDRFCLFIDRQRVTSMVVAKSTLSFATLRFDMIDTEFTQEIVLRPQIKDAAISPVIRPRQTGWKHLFTLPPTYLWTTGIKPESSSVLLQPTNQHHKRAKSPIPPPHMFHHSELIQQETTAVKYHCAQPGCTELLQYNSTYVEHVCAGNCKVRYHSSCWFKLNTNHNNICQTFDCGKSIIQCRYFKNGYVIRQREYSCNKQSVKHEQLYKSPAEQLCAMAKQQWFEPLPFSVKSLISII